MRYGIAAVLLLFPMVAFGAGFAKQSIFLSKSPVVEGDSVRVYAVVQNEAASSFSGKLVVKDGTDTLGSPTVTLAAGAAQTVSVTWTPDAGSHTIYAQLVSSTGTVVGEESEDFTIESKPKPVSSTTKETQSASAVESSSNIQNKLGGYSPAAENATKPVFVLIDGGRQAAADALDKAVLWSKNQIGSKTFNDALKSTVSGDNASDPAGAAGGVMNTLWFILATVALYVCSVLRWLVQSAAIFYPVFAVFILYVLWRIIRRFRRPSY